MLETVPLGPLLVGDAELAMVLALAIMSKLWKNIIERDMIHLTAGQLANFNMWEGRSDK